MKRKIALISVSNKTGIAKIANRLQALNFDIIASGGTADHLIAAGIPVTQISAIVGGKAILGRRVVTLSREVHAGVLAKNIEEDRETLANLNIPYIDVVIVDLYALEEEIKDSKSTPESVIEKTDIGGVALIRSAAKGRRVVICDIQDWDNVLNWLELGSPDEDQYLDKLAAKAEYVAAKYSMLSADYHGQGEYKGFIGKRVEICKYGENGYQTPAAFYQIEGEDGPLAMQKFELVAGDPLSYNNFCDLGRLLQTMTHIAKTFEVNRGLPPSIAIGVKHGNSCGAGIDFIRPKIALAKMLAGDPISLFGGLIMVNFPISAEIAQIINKDADGKRRFFNGIIAPSFSKEAIDILKNKNGSCRLVQNPNLGSSSSCLDNNNIFRYGWGGFLLQPNYTFILDLNHPELKKYFSSREFAAEGTLVWLGMENDMLLAKAICDTSNSNTITLVKKGQLIGNGAGGASRVRAARFAIEIARECGHDVKEAAAASDSYFPFVDGPETLAQAGVSAIMTTSGSIRDQEVINYCSKNGIYLLMIPDSIGRGFFNH